MRYRRLLLVGHSHIHCLVQAYNQAPANTCQMEYVYLHGDKKLGGEPDFADYVKGQIFGRLKALAVNGETPEQMLTATRQGKSDLLIAICLGGNAHNILGLIKANPPFDLCEGRNLASLSRKGRGLSRKAPYARSSCGDRKRYCAAWRRSTALRGAV